MEQLQVAYLLKDALEYKVNSEGKTITLMEDLGLMINVPPGAISDTHSSNEVMVRINACIRGPFELPEEYELASPIFHIEPGTKFAEKPVELSMVHYLDLRDEEACSNLKFISAPFKSETGIVKFKLLEGGAFWPDRRVGKVALQHFCLIGIARKSGSTSESEEGAAGTADLPSTVKPVIRNRSMWLHLSI